MSIIKVDEADLRELIRYYLKFSDYDEVEPTQAEIDEEVERIKR